MSEQDLHQQFIQHCLEYRAYLRDYTVALAKDEFDKAIESAEFAIEINPFPEMYGALVSFRIYAIQMREYENQLLKKSWFKQRPIAPTPPAMLASIAKTAR